MNDATKYTDPTRDPENQRDPRAEHADILRGLDLLEDGIINDKQFTLLVGLLTGRREQSERQKALGQLINDVSDGNLSPTVLAAAIEDTDPHRHPVAEIVVPEHRWRQCGDANEDGEPESGDKKSRLTTWLTINGTHVHLDAYEVRDDPLLEQQALQGDEDLDHYHAAAGADGKFDTTRIFDREYVVFANPFC